MYLVTYLFNFFPPAMFAIVGALREAVREITNTMGLIQEFIENMTEMLKHFVDDSAFLLFGRAFDAIQGVLQVVADSILRYTPFSTEYIQLLFNGGDMNNLSGGIATSNYGKVMGVMGNFLLGFLVFIFLLQVVVTLMGVFSGRTEDMRPILSLGLKTVIVGIFLYGDHLPILIETILESFDFFINKINYLVSDALGGKYSSMGSTVPLDDQIKTAMTAMQNSMQNVNMFPRSDAPWLTELLDQNTFLIYQEPSVTSKPMFEVGGIIMSIVLIYVVVQVMFLIFESLKRNLLMCLGATLFPINIAASAFDTRYARQLLKFLFSNLVVQMVYILSVRLSIGLLWQVSEQMNSGNGKVQSAVLLTCAFFPKILRDFDRQIQNTGWNPGSIGQLWAAMAAGSLTSRAIGSAGRLIGSVPRKVGDVAGRGFRNRTKASRDRVVSQQKPAASATGGLAKQAATAGAVSSATGGSGAGGQASGGFYGVNQPSKSKDNDKLDKQTEIVPTDFNNSISPYLENESNVPGKINPDGSIDFDEHVGGLSRAENLEALNGQYEVARNDGQRVPLSYNENGVAVFEDVDGRRATYIPGDENNQGLYVAGTDSKVNDNSFMPNSDNDISYINNNQSMTAESREAAWDRAINNAENNYNSGMTSLKDIGEKTDRSTGFKQSNISPEIVPDSRERNRLSTATTGAMALSASPTAMREAKRVATTEATKAAGNYGIYQGATSAHFLTGNGMSQVTGKPLVRPNSTGHYVNKAVNYSQGQVDRAYNTGNYAPIRTTLKDNNNNFGYQKTISGSVAKPDYSGYASPSMVGSTTSKVARSSRSKDGDYSWNNSSHGFNQWTPNQSGVYQFKSYNDGSAVIGLGSGKNSGGKGASITIADFDPASERDKAVVRAALHNYDTLSLDRNNPILAGRNFRNPQEFLAYVDAINAVYDKKGEKFDSPEALRLAVNKEMETNGFTLGFNQEYNRDLGRNIFPHVGPGTAGFIMDDNEYNALFMAEEERSGVDAGNYIEDAIGRQYGHEAYSNYLYEKNAPTNTGSHGSLKVEDAPELGFSIGDDIVEENMLAQAQYYEQLMEDSYIPPEAMDYMIEMSIQDGAPVMPGPDDPFIPDISDLPPEVGNAEYLLDSFGNEEW